MTDSTERRKPENRLDEKIATPTRKPFMTPTQLVAALKVRGVTFERCSEREAADYLAHANSCIINGFSVTSERADFPTSNPIAASMNERGLKSSKSRRSKMRNLRVAQIAAVLFASSEFCRRESTRALHSEAMETVREAFDAVRPLCPADGSLTSYFDFIMKLVDIWTPKRAQFE